MFSGDLNALSPFLSEAVHGSLQQDCCIVDGQGPASMDTESVLRAWGCEILSCLDFVLPAQLK